MVEFLLQHGAQCHVHPVTGHSPLHAACMAGNLRCAEAVLKVSGLLFVGDFKASLRFTIISSSSRPATVQDGQTGKRKLRDFSH